MSHNDFDFEPIRGLPAQLPEGEDILWQGAPQRAALARRLFKARWLGLYFAALAVWALTTAFYDGRGLVAGATSIAGLAAMGVAAVGLLQAYAWLIARTSVYTITHRRVVMRVGVALPITFNLPFRQITGAGLKAYPDGTGDLPLTLRNGQKIAYVHMWPHVRPWKFGKPEPMLRCIADADRVATLLAEAMSRASANEPAAEAADPHPAPDAEPRAPAMAPSQAA